MIKDGTGKKGVRNIFSGGVVFDSYECQKLEELRQYIVIHGVDEIPDTFTDD